MAVALGLLQAVRCPRLGLTSSVPMNTQFWRGLANGPTAQLLRNPFYQNAALPHNSVFDQRRNYAMRLQLTEHGISWRRPNYVPSWKPEKSGDLEPLKKVDASSPMRNIMAAKDVFDQVDEVTKRFLSLDMKPHKESVKILKQEVFKKVQRHKYDVSSMECTIAALTVRIRNLQEVVAGDRKNTIARCKLIEFIARRKKLLNHLRRMDYKRFEWLLEELNIIFKPFPTKYIRITRKDSLRKLVQMHKEDIRTKAMEEYRKILKDQEEAFLKEKEEAVQWIAKVESELGICDSNKS